MIAEDFDNLYNKLSSQREEWNDWLREIESQKLEARGRKIGVFVEDIPLPYGKHSHYSQSSLGNQYLSGDSLLTFRKLVRERAPQYRKERREVWTLVIQVVTAIAGLVGIVTGLVSALGRVKSP